MKGFVYLWTNDLDSKWYIGSHRGDVSDGYTTSSKLR